MRREHPSHGGGRGRIAIAMTVSIAGMLGLTLARLDAGEPPAPQVAISHVYDAGYARNNINSVAVSRNNLVTHGDQQFIAFNDADTVRLGRRTLGSDDWSVFDTGLAPVDIADDHDMAAIAIDGTGHLHLSWGMHNDPMNYAVSAIPVTGDAWSRAALNLQQPGYWAGTDATHDSRVTYPEFVNIPGSDDLLFTYRQAGRGGGAGDGDQYLVRYDAEEEEWDSRQRVINGTADSVNAYLNTPVYDSSGTLQITWTWRAAPGFQTNHNIMFARSPDDGQTWMDQKGNPHSLPLTKDEAQVIARIPQNSTLINQTIMAVDSQDRPLIATWYAPGAAEGDHTRQYMLHYFDGTDWHVSQITNRPREYLQDDSTVRDLGRPIVLVDEDDRVYVVMRYSEADNHIIVGVSEDRDAWDFITLSDVDLGLWEPTYDPVLWKRENKLHLFHQPLGLGEEMSAVSVLEWDARAHFATTGR